MLKTAVSKAKAGSIRAAFRNEQGAIDLASIMVGIIVIGIIGGVIAATVFAVIPWAQDNAAKGALDSVATAQSAYRGFTAEAGNSVFGTEAELAGEADSAAPATVKDSPLFVDGNDQITIDVTDNGQTYVASVTSSTGTVFQSTNGGKAVDAGDGSTVN